MKYSEIDKISRATYSIDVPLDHLKSWLKRQEEDTIFYGGKFELNPDFQRGHVWSEEQQIKYMEALFANPYLNKNIMFNSPFYDDIDHCNKFYKDMVCVDGLQRITSCLKFLNNEIPIYGYYYKDFEDRLSMTYGLKIHVNSLQTKKEVLKWYLDLNSGGTVHTEEELSKVKNMIENGG